VRWHRALSVAALPLAVYGCAAPPVVLEPAAPRAQTALRPARPGCVIAAPHAERQVRDIAAELARRSGFALVVDPVRDAAQGPLAFYAEIRGDGRRDAAGRIEIAAFGVDAGLAGRLRTLYELIRDAHLRAHPGTPRLDMLVTPADAGAAASQRESVLRLAPRALSVELPRAARGEAREPYLAILAEFLAQAATLPAGR
jgi:hypothetical protein